jgi:hypothetical protein
MSSADALLAALAAKATEPRDRLVIVDFDETLWLRNSTEEYLRSLRPSLLAYCILLFLDLARPWKLIARGRKEHVYRDWLRVAICTALMPWSLVRWRRQAPALAEQWKNTEMIRALAQAGVTKIDVATLGTDVIVAPLLRHIDPGAMLLAAGSLWSGHRIRDLGKKAWIEARHGPEKLQNAIVITDRETDADLLSAYGTPILLKWPGAEYRPALSDAYIPFLYTQRGKRADENYMLYGVALEDIVLLCLAFAWTMPSPLPGALGLVMLHLSFWVIYELGYVENDLQSVRHEVSPRIWKDAGIYADRVRTAPALLASFCFGAVGVWLLTAFNGSRLGLAAAAEDHLSMAILVLAIWAIYLAAARTVFGIYNRTSVQRRTYLYVVLQLFRTIGYAIFIPLNLVGSVALLSLVLARWVKYLAYRDMGRTLAEDQRLLMLLLFIVLGVGAFAVEGTGFLTLQTLAVIVWLTLYSHRRLRQVLRQRE